MARADYRVDYHLIQTIYFAHGEALSGPEFAKVWSATRAFGSHQVLGAFWHTGAEIPSKLPRFELGSLGHVEPLLAKGSQPIYGGGTVAKRKVARDATLDADFYFAHSCASRWQAGETLPNLLFSISGQWLENAGVELVLKTLKECFAEADRHAPPYGLVDLARSEDCFAGMAYVSTWMQRIPLQRWVEQGNWVYGGSKKGDRARGIYWGNYFGPKILKRLGGRGEFVKRYREQARLADKTPNAHIWEFDNGVFVTLSLSPLGCKPGMPLDFSAMFNLEWLHNELGTKGVLCGWDGDHEAPGHAASSKDPASVPLDEFQSGMSSQSHSGLNAAEEEWVRNCVDHARMLVQKYVGNREAHALTPVTLDLGYARWLALWRSRSEAEEPNTVVNAIGLAFGQWLVDNLGMEWATVTDVNGTDIALRHGRPAHQVLVFPTHAVAKRLESNETGFLEKLTAAIRAQLAGP